MKKIVIVGGGFAGACAAKGLLKRLPPGCALTMINPSPFFAFKPLLHEVATGVFGPDVVCEPVQTFLRHRNFEFIKGHAKEIDFKKQAVSVGELAFPYDYLVIATGSRTNFFGVPGAEEFAFKVETIEDALRIKSALLAASKKGSPRIVVVGAGPTGSEVSTEISEFMHQLTKGDFSLTVVDSSSDFLPQVREKSRALVRKFFLMKRVRLISGRSIVKVGKGFVVTDAAEKIPADVVVWAAGVKPASVSVRPAVELPRGFFPVDSFLRVGGYENVFAVGDCSFARNPGGSQVPQLAQSASDEGKFVADNVLASINKRPLKKFVFRQKGFILPLGKGRAVAEVYGVSFDGFFAWWLNRAVYLVNMFSFSHKLYVLWRWSLGFFQKRGIKEI